jgi:integrase
MSACEVTDARSLTVMRCGEMMALRWTDVDFRKRQRYVERSD